MEKTEAEKAEEFKQQGNEFFKKKEYLKAIECYTKAISTYTIFIIIFRYKWHRAFILRQ
jgi:hypothetical protein